jgi:hypothetical protein
MSEQIFERFFFCIRFRQAKQSLLRVQQSLTIMMRLRTICAATSSPQHNDSRVCILVELTNAPRHLLAAAITRRVGLAAIVGSAIALIGVAALDPVFAEDKTAGLLIQARLSSSL